MSTEQKTHWRKIIDPEWIGAYVLPNQQPITVQIDRVVAQKSMKVAGKVKDANVAHFKPNQYFTKPMLLNPTNCKRLSKLTGSQYIDDWAGTFVTLQAELDKMPDGTKDYALRISPIKPVIQEKPKPIFEKDSDNWNKALAKKATIETIKQYYQISETTEHEYTAKLRELETSKEG